MNVEKIESEHKSEGRSGQGEESVNYDWYVCVFYRIMRYTFGK